MLVQKLINISKTKKIQLIFLGTALLLSMFAFSQKDHCKGGNESVCKLEKSTIRMALNHEKIIDPPAIMIWQTKMAMPRFVLYFSLLLCLLSILLCDFVLNIKVYYNLISLVFLSQKLPFAMFCSIGILAVSVVIMTVLLIEYSKKNKIFFEYVQGRLFKLFIYSFLVLICFSVPFLVKDFRYSSFPGVELVLYHLSISSIFFSGVLVTLNIWKSVQPILIPFEQTYKMKFFGLTFKTYKEGELVEYVEDDSTYIKIEKDLYRLNRSLKIE